MRESSDCVDAKQASSAPIPSRPSWQAACQKATWQRHKALSVHFCFSFFLACGVETITAPDKLSRWLMLSCASPAPASQDAGSRRDGAACSHDAGQSSSLASLKQSQKINRGQPEGKQKGNTTSQQSVAYPCQAACLSPIRPAAPSAHAA